MFKRSQGLAILVTLPLLIFVTAAQTISFNTARLPEEKEPVRPRAVAVIKRPAPVVYGIRTDSLEAVESIVERGETLSGILADYNISAASISLLADKAKDVYDVRRINAGRSYTILHLRDSARTAQYFVYEPNEVEYVIYDLRGGLDVTKKERKVKVLEKTLAGEIKSSLFESMLEAGGSAQLVNRFADIYAWRLDLNRLQPGDKFKLIYEEKEVNGATIGFGELKAAYFEHNGQPLYAIGFDQGSGMGYFDQEGKSLKKAFLKEPLEYSRISSRFTMRRFHPVQKRYKAHLGTDFAAPHGTPIRTVGDGVVLEARYTRGNGYYVKIKHNKTYATQYLHMSKFAKGMKAGARVKQGQTIGYVGSTGLATGPHLCYRFWQNGRQVDALRVNLPAADPIGKKHQEEFTALKEQTIQQMQALDAAGAKPGLLATGKKEDATGA